MKGRELRKLLEKYVSGSCTVQERKLLQDFFDSFQDQKDIWEETTHSEKDRVRSEILTQLQTRIEKADRRVLYRTVWRSAATWTVLVVGLGVLAAYFLRPVEVPLQEITKITAKGQMLTVKLPDGSLVKLNAESQITYPEQFGKSREVWLVGEAFFDVRKNPSEPFIVHTKGIDTRVLGTSFNVKAYFGSLKTHVTVATGKVMVATKTQGVELIAGEEARYDSESQVLASGKASDVAWAWKRGVLIFDGSSMSEVARLLRRWYGVEIEVEIALQNRCELDMSFDNLSLKEVLKRLKIVTGISYEFVGSHHVKIFGNACEN